MSSSEKQIQWFPGHMTKTLRQMEKDIRNVDVIVEIMDARIPWSSQNPVLRRIGRSKRRIYILTKEDLADPVITEAWLSAFRKKEGYDAIAVNTKDASKTRKRLYAFLDAYFENNGKRILGKPRLMFVGVPNVGKSSVINILLGQNVARVEDRPGVTRGKQWFSTEQYELLDMPGVLWPKFDDPKVGYNLAFTGAVRDEVFDLEEVASLLIQELRELYPENMKSRMNIEIDEHLNGYEILQAYARKRGFLLRGAEADTERAAKVVLNELRAGKYGRVTLEKP